MISLNRLTSLLCFVASCTAAIVIDSSFHEDHGASAFWSCKGGALEYVYDFVPLGTGKYYKYYDTICGYPPATGTLYLCAANVTNDSSDKYMMELSKFASEKCSAYSSYQHDSNYYYNQFKNATESSITSDDITNLSLPLFSPTLPNLTDVIEDYIYYKYYYINIDKGTYFCTGICAYFLLLIVIGAIYNFCRETSISKSINNSKLSKLCQQYIIFPVLFPKGKFSEEYSFKFLSILIPNRIQFISDVFLFALQVAFYSASYHHTSSYSWQRFVADRTGIMAFGKIPLIVLFAGRNNFLLWVTGWSYTTFLHFHKMLAYWMFLDAMIHGVAYTIIELGYYVQSLKETYFACGVAAMVLCGMLLLQSLHPFRKLSYEVFLVFHIVLALGFIIMCWYHCNILGWLEWLIAACCVWFFDRLVRVIRMANFGIKTATISVVGDDLFKIEVPKPKLINHVPGHYYYVYFAGWTFWQNHPFTTVLEGDNLCTYIRVKKGITERVWKQLLSNNNQMQWKVCYEGPYGGECARKLKKYDDALLIAGGSGVPGVLDSATRVSGGKMVWVAQTLNSVKAYKPLLEKINTDLELYITRETGTNSECTLASLFADGEWENDSSSKNSSKDSSDDKKVVVNEHEIFVTINYNRPNVENIINSYVKHSPSANVGIIGCGPPQLMDNIRHVLAENVTLWDKSVDFFDEFQIW